MFIIEAEMRKYEVFIGISAPYSNIAEAILSYVIYKKIKPRLTAAARWPELWSIL